MATSANRNNDGDWQVSGAKRYISNLENATHSLVLVNATDERRSGPTVFLIDLACAGVDVVGSYGKMGTDSVGAWRLELDCVLPNACRLGPVGAGLAVLLGALRYERMAVARAVLSGARHSLKLSLEFLRQRESQGGRLYDLSALSHRVAQSWIDLQAAEALLERLIEQDQSGAASDADYAAVKFHAATTAQRVADAALQLLGGRGYTHAFPHERILRDIRLGRIGAGTDELMLAIVARHLDAPDVGTIDQIKQQLRKDVPNRE